MHMMYHVQCALEHAQAYSKHFCSRRHTPCEHPCSQALRVHRLQYEIRTKGLVHFIMWCIPRLLVPFFRWVFSHMNHHCDFWGSMLNSALSRSMTSLISGEWLWCKLRDASCDQMDQAFGGNFLLQVTNAKGPGNKATLWKQHKM